MANRWDRLESSLHSHSLGIPSSGKHLKQDSKPRHRQYADHRNSYSSTNTLTSLNPPPHPVVPHTKGRQQQRARRSSSNQRPQLSHTRGTDYSQIDHIEKELSLRERKKSGSISLNHLLNFTITPREAVAEGNYSDHYSYHHRRTKKHYNFNKEQFLQANCQFVVREGTTDYSLHCADPDTLVDWDYVEQVRLFCHDIPSCPICLYPPSAAKITKCGHLYCFSCILHYLSLTDKKWRKCPICYESIYKKDLKSVTTIPSKQYEDNEVISMRLMMRHQDSTLVLPKSEWSEERSTQMLPLNGKETCRFVKLLSASPDQIRTDILDVEQSLLKQQLEQLDTSDESERCFIETALQDLLTRRATVSQVEDVKDTGETTPTSISDSALSSDDKDEVFVKESPQNNSGDSMSPHPSGGTDSISSSEDDDSFCSISHWNTSEYVHFYQSTDGQCLYLHPINTKCLLKEYGGWDKCPQSITARITEIDQYTMNEDERGRYKYLSHLPLTCEFALCELDLKPPLVSVQTLEMFADQLQKRKNHRQRKRREEKRREKKAERENSYLSVDLPSNPADIGPEHLHNFLSMASSPPLPSPFKPLAVATNSPPSPADQKGNSSTTPPNTSNVSWPSVPSFAQALSSSSSGGGGGGSVVQRKSTSSNSSQIRKALSSPSGDRLKSSNDLTVAAADDDDDHVIVPSFQNAFSDALLTTSHSVKAATQHPGGKPGGSKTAKKGCKKLVLFSTGGQRRL